MFPSGQADIEPGDGILVRLENPGEDYVSAYPILYYDPLIGKQFYIYDKYGRYKGLSRVWQNEFNDLTVYFRLWLLGAGFDTDEVVYEDGDNHTPSLLCGYYLGSVQDLVGKSFIEEEGSLVKQHVVDDKIYPVILNQKLLNLTKVGNQYRWGYVPWQNGVASVVDRSPISSIESELYDPQDIEGYIEQLGFQADHYENMDGLFGYPILLTVV